MNNPPRPVTKDFNPGGARYCEQHTRMECTKHRKRSDDLCHKLALRGQNACRTHIGIRTDRAMAIGEANITAWSAIGRAGVTIDPSMAVLGVLQMSWLRLAAYSRLLEAQVIADRDDAEAGGEVEFDPSSPVPEEFEVEGSGLIGFRYGAAGKDGVIYRQNEEVRALVMLEAAERDRVVKYAKVAHDMGISQKLTDLAERWADVVALKVTRMFDEMELTADQQLRIPMLVQSHLGSIDMDGS